MPLRGAEDSSEHFLSSCRSGHFVPGYYQPVPPGQKPFGPRALRLKPQVNAHGSASTSRNSLGGTPSRTPKLKPQIPQISQIRGEGHRSPKIVLVLELVLVLDSCRSRTTARRQNRAQRLAEPQNDHREKPRTRTITIGVPGNNPC